jgi:hypothetical protein
MFRKLKRLLKRPRRKSRLEAEVEELRVAVAALLQRREGAQGEGELHAEAVLLHAAEARIIADELQAAYGALAMRVAEIERRLRMSGDE